MSNTLEQLKEYTTIVADTCDLEQLKLNDPTDATTNPSLLLAAINHPKFDKLFNRILDSCLQQHCDLSTTLDNLCVGFGVEILKIIPGRVSTEVDPRISYDKDALIKRSTKLISLYEKQGISRDRVLIKLASTWEGICAACELEQKHNIKCNLTLLFSFEQAVACADANVTLISPFVGRIYDYYAQTTKRTVYENGFEDPGVIAVTRIYNYYKIHGYKTAIMGASFRNISQIKCLAGCDLLTISPNLLSELANEKLGEPLKRVLSEENAKLLANSKDYKKIVLNESIFKKRLSENEMASSKLEEGVQKFSKDMTTLENIIKIKLLQKK